MSIASFFVVSASVALVSVYVARIREGRARCTSVGASRGHDGARGIPDACFARRYAVFGVMRRESVRGVLLGGILRPPRCSAHAMYQPHAMPSAPHARKTNILHGNVRLCEGCARGMFAPRITGLCGVMGWAHARCGDLFCRM